MSPLIKKVFTEIYQDSLSVEQTLESALNGDFLDDLKLHLSDPGSEISEEEMLATLKQHKLSLVEAYKRIRRANKWTEAACNANS